MAIFKCRMCGGTVTLTEGQTVWECEYCGCAQSLPKPGEEERRSRSLRSADLDFGGSEPAEAPSVEFYDRKGRCLYTDPLKLEGMISPGDTCQVTMTYDLQETEETRQLYEAQLEDLKIVYRLDRVTFERNKEKTYKSGNIKLLSDITR